MQYILKNLFGMPLVPATAMNFDRKATALGRSLYEELRIMLQSADVAYADETSWREDGQGTYLWFGGNEEIAVYQIADRSGESAVQLLGEDYGGTLVTDDYCSYGVVGAKDRQTCWNHIRTKAKEVVRQIELTNPPISAPRSIEFCKKLQRFAVDICALDRKQRSGKLSLTETRAMIPALKKRLTRFGSEPLEHEAAEALRKRVMVKDWDKFQSLTLTSCNVFNLCRQGELSRSRF